MASRTKEPPAGRWARRALAPWVILKGTLRIGMRYRVTGLAAEGAFFAVLSLPPLVFGLAGSIGYVIGIFGEETVRSVKAQIIDLALQALTEESVQRVIVPTLDAVLNQGRADIISIGFVLALWSGSRALNVFIDTISIMYGMGGRRGIVKTRLLSFTMYVIVLAAGVVVVPLVLAGPALVDRLLPADLDALNTLYWPTVVLSTSLFLTTLYHLAVPVRTPWRHDIPGAVLALLLWIGGSYLLRFVLAASVGGTSIYGPLAAPIAVLLWLYLVVISLLVGAAFNASIDEWLGRRPPGNGYALAGVSPDETSHDDEPQGEHRRDDPGRDDSGRDDSGRDDPGQSEPDRAGRARAEPDQAEPDQNKLDQNKLDQNELDQNEPDQNEPGRECGPGRYDEPLPFDEAAAKPVAKPVAGQPGVP